MASQYYRILPKQPPMKMYGFEKLSPSDLEMALVRLQRHTYCSEFAFGERFQRCPSPPRPPPLVCPKAPQVNYQMIYQVYAEKNIAINTPNELSKHSIF